MMRFIVPLAIILISVGVILGVANPALEKRKALEAEIAAYEVALQNARDLRAIRDDLLTKYNTISTREIDELETLLPDAVDNVKLVITIDEIAQRNGLVFSNANFSADDQSEATLGAQSLEDIAEAQKPYASSSLGFTVEGSYENFKAFVTDLEKSLRIIDIKDIGFSDNAVDKVSNSYVFDMTIQTYWLKSR